MAWQNVATSTCRILPPSHFVLHADDCQMDSNRNIDKISLIKLIICFKIHVYTYQNELCSLIYLNMYTILFDLVSCVFNSVIRHFQDYFSSYETHQSVGGTKTGVP